MRLFHAIRDLTADAFGGWHLVTNLQSGGGLFAQRVVARKHYDMQRRQGPRTGSGRAADVLTCAEASAPAVLTDAEADPPVSPAGDDAQVRLDRLPPVGELGARFVVGDRGDDDHVLTLLPVDRRRDLVLGGQLQGVDHPQDLGEVAPVLCG